MVSNSCGRLLAAEVLITRGGGDYHLCVLADKEAKYTPVIEFNRVVRVQILSALVLVHKDDEVYMAYPR